MSESIREQIRQTLIQDVAPHFRGHVPLEQQRAVLDGMGAASALAPEIAVERGQLAGRVCEWLRSPGVSEEHALLHLHGGGYVMGGCASHHGLTAAIAAAAGVVGIIPEYRLAPEHPFPAALDDAVAAYRALLDGGLDASRIVLLGDSAGGGLALSTLVALRDAGTPLPAAAVLLSPYTDMSCSGASMVDRVELDPWLEPTLLPILREHYRGDLEPADPRISPLFADLHGLPPLLVHVGDHEILLSDSTRLAERARAAAVSVDIQVWPELWHVFHLFAPALPEANEAIAGLGVFIRKQLGLR